MSKHIKVDMIVNNCSECPFEIGTVMHDANASIPLTYCALTGRSPWLNAKDYTCPFDIFETLDVKRVHLPGDKPPKPNDDRPFVIDDSDAKTVRFK